MRFDMPHVIATGRLGPVGLGSSRASVEAALGQPSTFGIGDSAATAEIWVYGRTLGRGHLELHFAGDGLSFVFADYLPLRRFRNDRFDFEPGCFGGLTLPNAKRVIASLASGGVHVRQELRAPNGETVPPNAETVEAERFGKSARRGERRDVQDATIVLDGGGRLSLGYVVVFAAERSYVSDRVVTSVSVPLR